MEDLREPLRYISVIHFFQAAKAQEVSKENGTSIAALRRPPAIYLHQELLFPKRRTDIKVLPVSVGHCNG